MTRAIQLLVFDWDGTLCDSLSRIVHCLQLSAAEVALPVPSEDEGREIIGLGLKEALMQLFPGIDDTGIESLRQAYARHYVALDQEPTGCYDGVPETLEQLKAEGYTLAVATGKSRKGLDRVLNSLGLGDFFDLTRCADETASKPHPLMLHELMAESGCGPDRSLMVGDTEFDMQMALSAGMARVGVSWGAHHPERLRAYELLACLEHFSEIKTFLNS